LASPRDVEEIKKLGDFIDYLLKNFLRYPDIYPEIRRMKFIFSGLFWTNFPSGRAALVSSRVLSCTEKFFAGLGNMLEMITAKRAVVTLYSLPHKNG
jgi:hypothetical protein